MQKLVIQKWNGIGLQWNIQKNKILIKFITRLEHLDSKNMKTLKLTESDCIFVHYVLRMYAKTTEGLDYEDKQEIYEVANKFK